TANANSTIQAGSPLTYTMTVYNAGPASATGVVLHTVVPPGTSYISIGTTQGSCNPPAGTEIVSPLGNIAAGGSVVITLQLNVTASSGSAISVQAWLTADSD